MSIAEQFLNLWLNLSFIGMAVLCVLVTGLYGAASNIYRRPTGFKTGNMSAIAFALGALAVLLAK